MNNNRLHHSYRKLCQLIIEEERHKSVADIYDHYANKYDVYDKPLYDEAVKLGQECKQRFKDETFINSIISRMMEWPVVYTLIVCKQVPCKKLTEIIGYKSFRPLAEELMDIIFGK